MIQDLVPIGNIMYTFYCASHRFYKNNLNLIDKYFYPYQSSTKKKICRKYWILYQSYTKDKRTKYVHLYQFYMENKRGQYLYKY